MGWDGIGWGVILIWDRRRWMSGIKGVGWMTYHGMIDE